MTTLVEYLKRGSIPKANTTNFIRKNVICRFGIPASIMTDNGKEFDNAHVRDICEQLKISMTFFFPPYPQANVQVEVVNKKIKENLKMKLEKRKGVWADELPMILWAYRTTVRNVTGETPFRSRVWR